MQKQNNPLIMKWLLPLNSSVNASCRTANLILGSDGDFGQQSRALFGLSNPLIFERNEFQIDLIGEKFSVVANVIASAIVSNPAKFLEFIAALRAKLSFAHDVLPWEFRQGCIVGLLKGGGSVMTVGDITVGTHGGSEEALLEMVYFLVWRKGGGEEFIGSARSELSNAVAQYVGWPGGSVRDVAIVTFLRKATIRLRLEHGFPSLGAEQTYSEFTHKIVSVLTGPNILEAIALAIEHRAV